MKRRILYITFCILILLITHLSCIIEDLDTRKYYLENDTDKKIAISFYDKIDDLDDTQLSKELNEKGQFIEARIDQSSFDGNVNSVVSAYYADSIKIVFDQQKILIYTVDRSTREFSQPLSRNIFKHNNYEHLGDGKFRFKITEQDYENAQPCDGNCD